MDTRPLIGLIRVLTVDDPEALGVHGRIIEGHFPGLRVLSRCIPDQPEGIHDDLTQQTAEPKIVDLAEEMASHVDAIVVTCCADPAVPEMRRRLRIPVIGAGSAVASLARAYSHKVCVVGLSAEPPRVVTEILGPALVGSVAPEGVRIAPDLVTPAGKRGVLDVAARAKEMGAGAIALACGAMATAGVAPLIAREYGIPTVDPVVACGLFAWHALAVAAHASAGRESLG